MDIERLKVKPRNRIRVSDYDNQGYTSSRLSNCVVRITKDKHPARVDDVGPDKTLYVSIYGLEGSISDIKTGDDVEISHLPLGNSLLDGTAFYLVKSPCRSSWKQSLNPKNTLRFGFSLGHDYFVRHSYGFGNPLDFYMPFTNHYPTVEQAMTMLGSSEFSCVPICREFSLSKSGKVFYRVTQIGKINLDNAVVTIRPKFSFLKECELPNSKLWSYIKENKTNE